VGKTDLRWDRLQTSEGESGLLLVRGQDGREIYKVTLPVPQDNGETYTAQRAAVLDKMVAVRVQAVGTCLLRHRLLWIIPKDLSSAHIHLMLSVDSDFCSGNNCLGGYEKKYARQTKKILQRVR